MMKMEEQIAEFVRDNPVLWDKNHVSYKNMKAKDRQWFRLATILGIPVDTVKRRWKTMRDRYYRILKRQEIATTNGCRITKYKYGGMLHFLDDSQKKKFKTEPNSSDNNYSDESNHNCDDQMEMENDEDCMKYEYIDTIAHTQQEKNDSAIPVEIQPLEENNIQNDPIEHVIPLPKQVSDLQMPEEMVEPRVNANFNNSPAHLFMLSLALQIDKANLPPESFLNLQIKMLKLVKDEIKQHK